MLLRERAEQILSLYNYFTGAIMTNDRGIIEYYFNMRPDINKIQEKEVLGKSVLSVYANITEETSSIMQVLRTGLPISNQTQTIKTYKGETFTSINSTVPIKDRDRVIGAVEVFRYVDDVHERSNIFLTSPDRRDSSALYYPEDIISIDPQMDCLKQRIRRVAQTDSTVLICGETGTGKELVAQSIHSVGKRRKKKFISQNCAAIPQTLLESILFGSVKGGFTGAEDRIGIFEAASGGTLFLDEIHLMDQGVQAKILNAIEEQQITRVGGVVPISVDVRIITAVNTDPRSCVREGRLREDLYFRLKVAQLFIPPLRQRKGDIAHLTAHFLQEYNRSMCRKIQGVSPDVTDFFEGYEWPGNVRELKNAIEGAFNLVSGEIIHMEDLDLCQEGHRYGVEKRGLRDRLKAFERQIILEAVKRSGTLAEAAGLLQITQQSLRNKLREYEGADHEA